GRTTIDGLWACGETASTGVHGANRLASNSLLEAVVFAARVANDVKAAVATAVGRIGTKPEMQEDVRGASGTAEPTEEEIAHLRRTMSRYVGVLRDHAGLVEALSVIERLEASCRSMRFLNMLAAAKI